MFRVESGSEDPDNLGHLGHFFGGSSGSYPQIKLSGCDPDITCLLEKSVGINFGESVNLMNALKYHWCETSLFSQAVFKRVVSKDFIFKKSAQGTDSVSYQG